MSVTLEIEAPLDALRHCESITRLRARNFYHGLKLLPEPKRSAMYALYAWMRTADDLVDASQEVELGSRISQVEAFREATVRAIDGDPREDDPMWTGLAFAAERFGLSGEQFHAMLDGQLDDVSDRQYRTFDELREYCYRVASTVGLLCIQVWGYSDPVAETLAIERGIAFQLTNILRDFREDVDSGRVYLPQEDFDSHGVTPHDVRIWSLPEQCRALVEAQVTRASSYYARSRELDDLIDQSCRPTLWAMTTIYHSLLRKIRANPTRLVSDRRIRLSWPTKAVIAIRAKTGAFNHLR